MSDPSTVRIAQLSDTHFLEDGHTPEGGFAYDTFDAFTAVRTHLEQQSAPDLVVVTGDVADHGRAAQYQLAANAFATLTAPVNVCPGNHDQDAAFTAAMGRPTVATTRSIELANWCFLFVDSNSGVMVDDDSGRRVDPPDYDARLHRNGSLGAQESAWVRDICGTTNAEHVFVWVHHPPAPPVGLANDRAYAQEWQDLLADLPIIQGIGGGHTHVPADYHFAGRPVFVSPALKNNFDLDANTMLPPGYRTYTFDANGTMTSHVHLVDDKRWPRHPLGRAVIALFNGDLTHEQFDAIVERKRAERAAG